MLSQIDYGRELCGLDRPVEAWLADLQHYPAVLTVTGLSVSSTGGSAVSVQFTLKAFYVPTQTLKQSHPQLAGS